MVKKKNVPYLGILSAKRKGEKEKGIEVLKPLNHQW